MADIQLSSQLFQDIEQAVRKQSPDADHAVVMQYLAAVIGYMLGSQRGVAATEREAFLDELFAFARHVHDDLGQRETAAAAPAGQAFGYWDPSR
jgi:hypothetical protein